MGRTTKSVWMLAATLLVWWCAVPCRAQAEPDEGKVRDEKALLDAARKGDAATVRQLLGAGVDPDAKSAVRMMEYGARPPVPEPHPLQEAALGGHLEAAAALLEGGADPSLKGIGRLEHQKQWPWLGRGLKGADWFQFTGRPPVKEIVFLLGHPLGAAAFSGNLDLVRLLVERARIDPSDLELSSDGTADGWSALMYGALAGHDRVCTYLLEKGAGVRHATADTGMTALHFAASYGDAATCGALLTGGADPAAKDVDGNTPLHDAAAAGYAESCMILAARGAALEARNDTGWTPLHAAAANGSAPACEALLALHADTDARDEEGRTPLHLAALGGHWRAAESLLTHGASPCGLTLFGETPLHLAAASGDVNTLLMLVQAGCRVDARNAVGMTALHYAALFDRHASAALLVQRGASLNATTADGLTPLHLAALQGSKGAMALLLVLGARPDPADSEGWTPLHFALSLQKPFVYGAAAPSPEEQARLRAWDPVYRLLEYGADPNAPNAQGETPLHLAVWGGDQSYCQALVEAGADVNAVTREGLTPLDYAGLSRRDSLSGWLEASGGRHGARPSRRVLQGQLIEACQAGDAEEVSAQLADGADPDTPEVEPGEALWRAAEQDCRKCVASLLASGAHPNVHPAGYQSALMDAIIMNHNAMALLLVEGGADPNTSSRWIGAALEAACGKSEDSVEWEPDEVRGHTAQEVVEALLAKGADVKAVDELGWTAIHEAAWQGNTSAMKALLARGADVNAPTSAGLSPVDVATMALEDGAVEFLQARGGRASRPLDAELLSAVEDEDEARIDELLKAGARPTASDEMGITPLHVAVRRGDLDLARRLVAAGAEVDAVDRAGWTPLHEARPGSGKGREMATWLLEQGARGGPNGVIPMSVEEATLYLQYHLPMEDPVKGTSWLFNAVRSCQVDLLGFLLSRGANPNIRGPRGGTPLHGSAQGFEGSFDEAVVDLLLKAGADPNAADDEGRTPAHATASVSQEGWLSDPFFDGRIPMLRALAAAGGDLARKDYAGKTPRDMALERHGIRTALWLRRWTLLNRLGLASR